MQSVKWASGNACRNATSEGVVRIKSPILLSLSARIFIRKKGNNSRCHRCGKRKRGKLIQKLGDFLIYFANLYPYLLPHMFSSVPQFFPEADERQRQRRIRNSGTQELESRENRPNRARAVWTLLRSLSFPSVPEFLIALSAFSVSIPERGWKWVSKHASFPNSIWECPCPGNSIAGTESETERYSPSTAMQLRPQLRSQMEFGNEECQNFTCILHPLLIMAPIPA